MGPRFLWGLFLGVEGAIDAGNAQRLVAPARPTDRAEVVAAALAGGDGGVFWMDGAAAILGTGRADLGTRRLEPRLVAVRTASAGPYRQRLSGVRTARHLYSKSYEF